MSVKGNQTEFAAALTCALKKAESGSPPSVDIARDWVKQAQGDAALLGMAMEILGHAHQHACDHRAAQAAFAAAAGDYRQAGLLPSATKAYILLGTSRLLSGEPLLAFAQWSNALELARDTHDLAQCARVYLAVSQVYIGFGNDKAALHYNEMALKMAKVLGDSYLTCETHLYVVSDYLRLQRYPQALAELDCAEQLLSVPNKVWSAEIIYYRGAIHAKQGLYQQAKIELETACELSAENANLWGKIHALAALGEVLLALNDANTETILQQALSLAEPVNLTAIQTRCHAALIAWYLQQEQAKAALPLLAKLTTSQQAHTVQITAKHQQRIAELENRSRILQLKRELV